jgi:hypothetical protein
MPTVQVTITNTGGHTARLISVPGIGVYSVPMNGCTTLAPGQGCTAMIQFCPTAQGQYNSMLVVTDPPAIESAATSATASTTSNIGSKHDETPTTPGELSVPAGC